MLRVVPCKCLNCNAIQVPAGVGMGPGRYPGATRACGATPNGEMAVRAVVVGAGLQAIVDSIFSQFRYSTPKPGGRVLNPGSD